ncbi:Lipid-binding START domain protein [Pseudohyphozyma bogoriensis]|nr:Lipid-binding START domain protein [Pseudohyphozyma bogoriensis]
MVSTNVSGPLGAVATMESFESTHEAYTQSLNSAFTHFRHLLASSSSKSWKPLPSPSSSSSSASHSSNSKGKAKAGLVLEPSSVVVHKKKGRHADIVRAVADVELGSEAVDLDRFRAVLAQDDVRSSWDKLVERSHTLSTIDSSTRISKTDYRLGWPASTSTTPQKLRLTVFWEWSLRGAVFASHHSQIADILASFVSFVRDVGGGLPLVKSWGSGVEMGKNAWERERELGELAYSVLPDDEGASLAVAPPVAPDVLADEKRTVELLLGDGGWDIKIKVEEVGDSVETGYRVEAGAAPAGGGVGRSVLRVIHCKVLGKETLARVSIGVQRLPGGKGVRVNGANIELAAKQGDERSPVRRKPGEILGDEVSVRSEESIDTIATTATNGVGSSVAAGHVKEQQSTSNEIIGLLRRNYIYFTSLLQEPEAKWRHITDSHGVTVTQLNSIDPTLTIYRAEATFVGVGVWDVLATIWNPGVRGAWDKNWEDASLLEDVNELSQLWWIKNKSSWPVAPRDSVTLRTAYKSPSSVHIFAFSTDDLALFPSIPSPVSPTIRTQTDLYGWAIEALSPTTTQITLLDQSDPKGWSNKSWTPTKMVEAVAGVGDFSIKHGGPPVVTRMFGGKVKSSKYEHEKGVLRVEYKGGEVETVAEGFEESSVGKSRGAMGKEDGVIECEIRCDCSTWASSIDLVVDPPPARVSCLSRHRLSSGGGLWITIEHDKKVIEGERVLVMVRRGGSGREKGSVVVNGAKAKVDAEMLKEDEVKLLSKRKRVKASPIPLDQYSTHGHRSWTGSRSASGRTSPTFGGGDAVKADEKDKDKPTVLSSSPLAQAPLSAASDTPEITPPSPPKPPLPPAAQALEALAWLQTFHAEQGPELTDPAPGWAIVSERTGTVVRKKVINKVSEVLPVFRGDKIVQGLTAEEIASVVSAVGCRKAWDERIDTAIPLATYGHGLSTAVLTAKPVFPFKGRIFHVASVNAQVRVPSASAGSSTSTVVFCASASYTPDATFDSTKLNPDGLLSGQVLLEGWILETLDPYTSSMLAIPSTRCTYVTCVDQSGSVPLAQTVLNPNIARVITAVETLGKTKGPLPRLWMPDAGIQIEGPLTDDGDEECVWKLSNVESTSVLLSADYSADDGTFRSLFKVSGPKPLSLPSAAVLRKAPATLAPSAPVGSLASQLPRSASLNFANPPSNLTLAKPSSEIARKASLNSLRAEVKRSISPPSTLERSSAAAKDLVVAELVVDLKQFPNGYSIACSSSVHLDPSEPVSIEPLRSLSARQLPLYATAHDAPLPSILSASLDSWKRHNHLVRILVPTATITNPVQDPLREGKPKPTPPDWFNKLVDRGAVVEVRIVPLPEDSTAKGGSTRVMLNGELLPVASQKDSKAVLAKMEDEDWVPNGAKISRVPRKRKATSDTETGAAILPEQLQEPIAVAVRLLTPKPQTPVLEDVEFPDPKSPRPSTPNAEESLKAPALGGKLGTTPMGREHSASDASTTGGPLLGILGAYPLSRLSSSMTTTTVTTSDPTTPPQRTYTLTFVLLVALISFLVGSLLRSLLTPADYIIYSDPTVDPHVERLAMEAIDPLRRWHEARRLWELRSPFLRRNIILALVKKE